MLWREHVFFPLRQYGGQLCGVEGPRGLSVLLSVLFIIGRCLCTAGRWCTVLTGGGLRARARAAAVGVLIIWGLSVTESFEERTAPRLGHTGGPLRQQQCGKAGFSENGDEP